VALALGAPLRTMYHLIDVVGSPAQFLVVAAVALVAGAGLARVLRPVYAVAVGTTLFAVGLGWYIANLSTDPPVGALLADTVKLLTGRQLLQIANVELWVVSYAAAPVFLTTYFALRRWYGTAVVVAGATLSFFVLTTDAGVVTTLLGVVGGVAAVGFGRLEGVAIEGVDGDTSEGIDSGRRGVLEQLAAVILVPAGLSQVPGVRGTTLSLFEERAETIEGSLVDAGESLSIQGSISLNPEHRFTVESDEERYWRVAAYDRYTGDGWVRTGQSQAYRPGDRLRSPLGQTRRVRQRVRAESDIGTVPAAWKPVRYDGDPDIRVSRHDGFQPVDSLQRGDIYEVLSERLVSRPGAFRSAGEDYPDEVADTYLQVPDSTPDRVAETTRRLTANADNPFDTARVVERWLQANRGYSLEVSRPRRNVADRFLHAMNEGYCTYFATAMVVMLRTQGVPARFVVGYTPGQKEDGEWVVRGLHSHAWVEVSGAGHGWVQFDPTPAGPREAAEQERLEGGLADDSEPDDSPESTPTPADGEPEPTETPAGSPTTEAPTDTDEAPTETAVDRDDDGAGGLAPPALPSREEAALGLVALVGTAAGLRRTGVTDRVSRAVWLRYQRPEDPETDVERAFQRAMYVLGERHRDREPGETVRAYLDAVDADPDVRRLARLRERLRYGGTVSQEAADEAIELADSVVSDR
jgi:transglutaminase-like putative cysteine protease